MFLNRIPYLWNNLPEGLRTDNLSQSCLKGRDDVETFINAKTLILTAQMLLGRQSSPLMFIDTVFKQLFSLFCFYVSWVG